MLLLNPDQVWLRPYFLWACAICGIASTVVLFWPLRHAENRIKVGETFKHPQRWIAKSLEPVHVIILGLLIALAGAVWQYNRPKSLSQDDVSKLVAPFQAQIDALKRQQSVALLFDHPPPEPSPPQPSIRRVYLRVDAEALTAALRQMHDVLNESVRDSTTMQGFFLGFENRRRNLIGMPGRQPPSIKDEIADIQEHLKQVQDFHMKIVTDLSAITRQVSSSYRDDLNPFIEASNPTPALMEPMAQYRIYGLHPVPQTPS